MKSKILLVGGTFDDNEGIPSSLVSKFSETLNVDKVYNGGNYKDLTSIIEKVKFYDVVFWWANVSNNYEKVRDVKSISPRTLLITSKRNDNEKYSFPTLIGRALEQKANLVVEFNKLDKFKMRVFDPLGTLWYEGFSIEDCSNAILKRLELLTSVTRVPTSRAGKAILAPKNDEFYDYVKDKALTFHTLIPHDEEVTRFLGNSSFRCQKGFPSFRSDNSIYVSRRNIDKRYISKENFVKTFLDVNGNVCYYGKHKPSVDTPVQLKLYSLFKNINYMIHAHCYVQNAPFTTIAIPCGAIEEVDEIIKITNDFKKRSYSFNLIGHGCIVMGNSVEDLTKFKFHARKIPEKLKNK